MKGTLEQQACDLLKQAKQAEALVAQLQQQLAEQRAALIGESAMFAAQIPRLDQRVIALTSALDREVERSCQFNCDAESSCNCHAHELRARVLAALDATGEKT